MKTMRDNSKRGTSRLAVLGVLSLLALIVGMGAIRTNLAHAATTTVVVGQTNGGGATGVNQFNAATITVTRNDTVTWNSALDARGHTVVSAVVPAGAAAFTSPGTLKSGTVLATFSTTLAVDGVYTYFCDLHAAAADATLANVDANITAGLMVGKITVNAPAPDTTAPTVSAVAAAPNPTAGSGAVTLTATVTDSGIPLGTIAGAEWSKGAAAVTAGTGTAMAASDAAFNSATEGVTANVPISEAAGTSVTIWVRGRDSAGLWSTAVSTTVSVTAPPAGAVQATVTVSGGSLSNVAQNIAFPGVTVNGLDQTVAGVTTPAWQAKDARGTGAGWNVTVTSSNFTGTAGSIVVANFKAQLTAVTTIAGNTAPLPTPASYVALSSATPLKLLSAATFTGMGTYDYTPQFQLTVPGSALVGTYAANVTVSVNSGP